MARIHDYSPATQKEFRDMMSNMSRWPNQNGLPLKRPNGSGSLNLGTLLPRKDGEPFIVRIDFGQARPVSYQTVDDMVNDDWVVD
jgi:hypothetical protein